MKNPTRQAIWDKTGGRCFYCGLKLEPDDVEIIVGRHPYRSWMECDHLHPRSKGGLDLLDNLVPACSACNCTKGHRTLEEYRHLVAMRRDGRPKLTADIVEWLTQHDFQFPPLPKISFWFEENGFSITADIARTSHSPLPAGLMS